MMRPGANNGIPGSPYNLKFSKSRFMRTILDLPVGLVKRARAAAALEGKSLNAFLAEAVVYALVRSAKKKNALKKVSLQRVPSQHPGVLKLGSGDIPRIINSEDRQALAG